MIYSSLEGIKAALEKWLVGARLLIVLGIGNDLRGDDAAGLLVARILKCFNSDGFEAVECGSLLEACIEYAFEKKPSHLLIVDAFPDDGDLMILDPEELESRTPVSTHAIPLPLILEAIGKPSETSIKILGIGVKNFELGTVISDEYREVAEKVASIIRMAADALSLL